MKQILEDELMVGLMPYIVPEKAQDAKLRLSIILSGYSIEKETTDIVPYSGDINAQILKRFIMAKIARGCSPRTVDLYKNSVTFTLGRIGKPYNEITADDIRLYLAVRVHKDGVTKTTANNERRNLSAFYFWLQKEEILLKNPMNKVEVIKESKKKKEAFGQMDLEKIRNACETSMEKALVEVLISSWARVTEVSEMRIENMHDNKILVHGKGDKYRNVYLTPKAQLFIDQYLQERSDNNPYLFPKAKYAGDIQKYAKGRKRKEMAEWYKDPALVDEFDHRGSSTIESTIRTLGKKAGVKNVHPHRFRRTGATMALRTGMPLMTVSKLLGHENIGTTQIYLDISDKELEESHDKYVL